MSMTVFRCSHCGKELSSNESEYMGKHNLTECTDCRYFASIGVKTIADYNLWLKGEWKIKS